MSLLFEVYGQYKEVARRTARVSCSSLRIRDYCLVEKTDHNHESLTTTAQQHYFPFRKAERLSFACSLARSRRPSCSSARQAWQLLTAAGSGIL